MLRNLLLISLLWAIIILVLSGLPGDSLPDSKLSLIPHFDKLVHMGLYFPLAFFLMAEFSFNPKLKIPGLKAFITLLIIGLYGGLIELGQDYLFIHRSADWWDFAFDLFGGALGIIAYWLLGKWFFALFSRRKNN